MTKSQSQPNPFSSEPASTPYLPLDEPTIQAGGVYQAGGGKYAGSEYSFDSTYHNNNTGGGNTQYPPDIHYPPISPYPEPKSPVRSVHSYDMTQYPPPPATQYPPS